VVKALTLLGSAQQPTYPEEIGVSPLLSGILESRMFQQLSDIASIMSQELLNIASRMFQELLDIARSGNNIPRSLDSYRCTEL
jgi:hypothetical protein